ncbi:uncharacterized protein LOC110894063 isoform X2 [Helianthus annuus]|uniref:uncharacterized protein LOC110894063 isoform X2 n=1 Tax=Helianthus annuus TaxID=4232 RepID=UPI000B8FBEED|nr:uncharacterized protein LOC110894063 isoform X2 [Helianthus annuus]
MCGREPNFELTAEEKDELSKLIWDDFLTMTRNHDFSNFWKLMEKDFVGAATDLRPSCGVNRMIRLIELDRNQGFQIKWWNLAKTRLLVVSAFNAYVTGGGFHGVTFVNKWCDVLWLTEERATSTDSCFDYHIKNFQILCKLYQKLQQNHRQSAP